jgi:hypothetical protein
VASEVNKTEREGQDLPLSLPLYAIMPGHEGLVLTSDDGFPIWTDEDAIRTFLRQNGLGLNSYTEIPTVGEFLELLESVKAAGVAEVLVEGEEADGPWAVAIAVSELVRLVRNHAAETVSPPCS